MKDKEFELTSDEHTLSNQKRHFNSQISNDNKFFYPKVKEECYKKVIYDGSKESVKNIINLVGFTSSINNCHDFSPPKLLLNDIFFDVGTELRVHEGNIMTRDKNNFGYEFNKHELIRTLNWINLLII